MALINLQTNLKSLKFGKDRPGGGDSGQPYKTRPIDGKQSTTGGPDFLLRGGSLAPIRSVRDASRLTKFFFDFKNPRGMLFIAKQNVLSRQNVQTEVSSDIAKVLKADRTGYANGALNQGVYLPTSTILQAGVGFTGTHLNLFGIDPSDPMLKRGKQVNGLVPGLGLIYYGDFQAALQREGLVSGTKTIKKTKKVRNPYWPMKKKYPELWEETNGFEDQGGGPTRRLEIQYNEIIPSQTTNRLVRFFEEKQITSTSKTGLVGGLQGSMIGNLLGIDGPDVLYKYPGGPGSVLGIGKTTIRFASSNIGGPLRTGMNNAYATSNPDWFFGTAEKSHALINASVLENNQAYLGASTAYWADLNNNPDNLRIWSTEEKDRYGGWLFDMFTLYNTSPNTTDAFVKNHKLEKQLFYAPLKGIKDRSIIAGPNNFTLMGVKPFYGGAKEFYPFNYRAAAPMSGSYGFKDGASAMYGRAYVLSGADSGSFVDQISGIKYGSNSIDRDYNHVNQPYGFGIDKGRSWVKHNLSIDTGFTMNQQQLMKEKSSGIQATTLQSFSNKIYDESVSNLMGASTVSYTPDYTRMNKEKRLSFGNPGSNFKNVYDYAMTGSFDGTDEVYRKLALDKITAAEMYKSENASHPRSGLFTKAEGGKAGHDGRNDLAKFSIGIVQNDSTNESWWMHFRAFIDSFSDSYTADWKDIKYAGRSEQFYNYGGFSREISLGWTVIAQSKAELIPMYRKLNYLASSLAGDYSDGGFMRGNLYYLNVGGYLYKQLGVITGLTYDVPQETTWEIALTQLGTYDRSVKELPHMIKVTGVKFKPIHSFIPRRMNDPKNQKKTPFIALSNGANNNYTPTPGKYI